MHCSKITKNITIYSS